MTDSRPSDLPPSHTGADHEEPPAFARELWNTRVGFILAAVGSAVGLGNMWRFPYYTAEHGGAAFVALYIGLTFVIGIPLLLGEFTIGRRTHLSPIGALRKAGGRGWTPFGYMFVLAGFLILAFYSVIAGWVVRYAFGIVFTGFPDDPGAHFTQISSGIDAIGFHLFFMTLTIAIVMGGVEKGIERASLIMMPVLVVLVAGLAIWAATLAGSGEGYRFYLTPTSPRSSPSTRSPPPSPRPPSPSPWAWAPCSPSPATSPGRRACPGKAPSSRSPTSASPSPPDWSFSPSSPPSASRMPSARAPSAPSSSPSPAPSPPWATW
jgi:hypothetical protein